MKAKRGVVEWEEVIAWCLVYGKEIPDVFESDEMMIELLEGPIFPMVLRLLGVRSAVVLGGGETAWAIYQCVRRSGVRVRLERERVRKKADILLSDRIVKEERGQQVASVRGIFRTIYPMFLLGGRLSFLKNERKIDINLFSRYALTDFEGGSEEMEVLIWQQEKSVKEQDEYAREVFRFIKTIKTENGIKNKDCQGMYVNVVNGERVTTEIPEHYQITIYLFGDCNVFGYGVADGQTISSCLQRELNLAAPLKYKVENRGRQGVRVVDEIVFKEVEAAFFEEGDLLTLLYDSNLYEQGYFTLYKEFFEYLGINIYNTFADFVQGGYINLYVDNTHLSSKGMEAMAEIFKKEILKCI